MSIYKINSIVSIPSKERNQPKYTSMIMESLINLICNKIDEIYKGSLKFLQKNIEISIQQNFWTYELNIIIFLKDKEILNMNVARDIFYEKVDTEAINEIALYAVENLLNKHKSYLIENIKLLENQPLNPPNLT